MKGIALFLTGGLLLAQSVIFPGPGGGAHSAVTNHMIQTITPITLRNDYGGAIGGKIVMGGTSKTVTQIGVYCAATSVQPHTAIITAADGSTDLASVSVNTTGCTVGTYVYAAVSVTLVASTTYYIGYEVFSGGDSWCDNNAVIIINPAVASINTAYRDSGSSWTDISSPGFAFGVPDLIF